MGRGKHPHTWAHMAIHAKAHALVREPTVPLRKIILKPRECCVCMRAVRVMENHTNETEPPRVT